MSRRGDFADRLVGVRDQADLVLGARGDVADRRGDLDDRAAGVLGSGGELLRRGGHGAGGIGELADDLAQVGAHLDERDPQHVAVRARLELGRQVTLTDLLRGDGGLAQVLDHLLERGAGLPELVAGADVDVLLDVPAGDALGGVLHLPDAGGDPAGEPPGDGDAGDEGHGEQQDRVLALRAVVRGHRLVLRLPELDLGVEEGRERLGDPVEDRPDLARVGLGGVDHRLRVRAGARDGERLLTALAVLGQPTAQGAQGLPARRGPDRGCDGVQLLGDQGVVGLDLRLQRLLVLDGGGEDVVVQQRAVLVGLRARRAQVGEGLGRGREAVLGFAIELAEASDARSARSAMAAIRPAARPAILAFTEMYTGNKGPLMRGR